MQKSLGTLDVFSIASGVMISSGIFILPGLAYSRTGSSVIFAYMLAGFAALIGILSIIELVTAMPKSGGDYFIIHRSFGPLVGTMAGMLTWFALSLKSAFAIVGLGEIVFLSSGIDARLVSLLLTLLFVGINLGGVDLAGRIEVALVLLLLSLLGLFVVFGWNRVELPHYEPVFSAGAQGFISTIAFVFVSFGGLINVAGIAEEVRNPRRAIPVGILSSIILITLLYGGILYTVVGLLGGSTLSGSLTPLADAGSVLAGGAGRAVMNLAASLAFITTANAGILSASRYPLALSRDGLLPSFLQPSKTDIPRAGVILTGSLIATALFLPLDLLVKSASAVILSTYILTNLAVLALRGGKIQNYQPSFRAPFFPYLQIVAVLIFLGLIIDLGWVSIEASLVFIGVSLLIYFFFGRRAETKEYALLYTVERLVNRTLTGHGLEGELREIIRERDQIHEDSFDRLAREALVMDIDEATNYETLFSQVAEAAAENGLKRILRCW